jgi:superfamily II DNA or RNA helicase
MPRIFDNIDANLLPALRETLHGSKRADFCVGYFNLRGWASLADIVEVFPGGDAGCCRVLIGMHRAPHEVMREMQKVKRQEHELSRGDLKRLRQRIVQSFKEQIEFGLPTAQAEKTLRELAKQLRARKVVIKLFLKHPLHAKLYLVHRHDKIAPLVGYLGSSNLTLSGLSHQGELNVDVVEEDPAKKLQKWFNDRWDDPDGFDLSDELAELIENSWAGARLVEPYLVYLKMAYYLSEDARIGERDFKLPKVFQGVLLDFQVAAVQLASRLLYKNGGVLVGDVVGLGKTLMACAVARIFQEDDGSNILIICPPKLAPMWNWYKGTYGLAAEVLSLGAVITELPNLPPYRLVLVDESHNLRNRDGKRYRAIQEFIEKCNSRVIMLTATPYNKQFTDLSNQLRLFVDEDADLHVRPEQFFQEWQKQGLTEADFMAQHQASPRSLRAFELSSYSEDWRDLMRHYMVRRTRRFIMQNYSKFDEARQRYFFMLNGAPYYFPLRQPKTLPFDINENDPNDPYAKLYRDAVVQVIAQLALPRYGLANYLTPSADKKATPDEKKILENLTRAGKRLLGFCRTNLFKRLESDGYSFLLSLERHILRNMVHVHALKNGLPIPIGTQEAAALDSLVSDTEDEFANGDEDDNGNAHDEHGYDFAIDLGLYHGKAQTIYSLYQDEMKNRFYWLDPKFFRRDFKDDLLNDANALLGILQLVKRWHPMQDSKLQALKDFLSKTHPDDKVLVFTQYADTANYLGIELDRAQIKDMVVVTSESNDPVGVARRFSPQSNGGLRADEVEYRVLIATDVLSEGQNLQDAHIVVNFDLPWAIIRLIQRAGRADRIGQKHDTILAYSFLPAEGVERIIQLRSRLFSRLLANQEVVGTDETFIGEAASKQLHDLYTEKRVLDDDPDDEVDLVSFAQQVWNTASEAHQKACRALPLVIPASRAARAATPNAEPEPPGLITYLRFPDGTDALVRVDDAGKVVSQSISAIFRSAACGPDTPALPLAANHYDLLANSVQAAQEEQMSLSGQLGSFRSTRRKLYERLRTYREKLKASPTLFSPQILQKLEPVLNILLHSPLKESASDSLRRQMRLGISDELLAENVFRIQEEDRLCQVTEIKETPEPQILCSLGVQNVPVA